MISLRLSPLHELFGAEVHQFDLRRMDNHHFYPQIREAFETHSVLLFRDQELDEQAHFRIAGLFGPVENREKGQWGKRPDRVSRVSNVDQDGQVMAEDGDPVRNLKANQLWHTDSTFLPAPALANVLAAQVVPDSGGETELVSTRVAWQSMPAALKSAVRDALFVHRYSHSRARIDPGLATNEMFTMWGDQVWRAIWPNPANGQEALYLASHICKVVGLDPAAGERLVNDLIDYCTRPAHRYSHRWTMGDVLIWDERATMHRGRPWPYDEARTLASLCVTARDADGLDRIRVDSGGLQY